MCLGIADVGTKTRPIFTYVSRPSDWTREISIGSFGLKFLGMSQKKSTLFWSKNENRKKFCLEHLFRREFGYAGKKILSLEKIFNREKNKRTKKMMFFCYSRVLDAHWLKLMSCDQENIIFFVLLFFFSRLNIFSRDKKNFPAYPNSRLKRCSKQNFLRFSFLFQKTLAFFFV